MPNRYRSRVTFTKEDLKSVDRLERVLRQFERVVNEPSVMPVVPPLDIDALTAAIRNRLQAPGAFPLNLELLLPSGGSGVIFQGTHAVRLSTFSGANIPSVGSIFYETDRTVYYAVFNVSGVLVWQCIPGGYMKGTLSPDQKPSDLGGNDVRFEFFSTDFSKFYRWTGSAWERRGDQDPAGMIGVFRVGPAAGIPGWQLCDGSTVDASRDDGTINSITVPDYSTSPYLKISTVAVEGPTAASGITADTVAVNQDESAHTHDVNPPNTTSTTESKPSVEVQSGTGINVSAPEHTHDVNVASFSSGAGSAHTHIQDAHNHAPGTLELLHTQLRAYYRL